MISSSECDWQITLTGNGELINVEFGTDVSLQIKANIEIEKIDLNNIPSYQSEQLKYFCEEINRIESYGVSIYEKKENKRPTTLLLGLNKIYLDETNKRVHTEGKQYIADYGELFLGLDSNEFKFIKNNFHSSKKIIVEIYIKGDEFYSAYEKYFSEQIKSTIFVNVSNYLVKLK